MECPGMSLFQEAGSIHVNNSAQARLEEEHIEDQKRRNEELKYDLENAFDDLIDEDDGSSVNSSSNFPSSMLIRPNDNLAKQSENQLQNFVTDQKCCALKHTPSVQDGNVNLPLNTHVLDQYEVFSPLAFRNHGMGDINTVSQKGLFPYDNHYQKINKDYNDGHFAEANGHNFENDLHGDYNNLLISYQQIAAELKEMRVAQKSAIGHMAIAKSEREQSELSLRQAHELLVESKHRVLQMEEEIKVNKQAKLDLEIKMDEMSLELTAATASLSDCQHRLQTVKANNLNNTDHLFEKQQERHKEEIERLYEDLEKARNRLNEKNKEVLEAERRAKESEKEKEDLLIDKGVTINRLAVELEQAQVQLNQVKQERNTAKRQVKELGSKLESIALELSAAREEKLMVETALDGTLAAATSGSTSMVTSTPTAARDKLNIVKTEMVKYLNRLHQKDDQINKLGQTIKNNEQQIKKQNIEIEEAMVEIEATRTSEVKHKNEIKILQHRLELFKSNSRSELLEGYKSKNEELEEQIVNLRKEVKSFQLQHCEVEMELNNLRAEKSRRTSMEKEGNSNLVVELGTLTSQLVEARKEAEHFRALYLEMCAAKEQMLMEMIKLRTSDAHKQLEVEKEKVANLRTQIDDHKVELDQLKERLHQYEEKAVERTDSPSQTEAEDKKLLTSSGAQTETSQLEDKMDKTLVIENLRRDVSAKNKTIEDLQIKIEFQLEKGKLVDELFNKAKMFEAYIIQHYMRLADKRDASTEVDLDAVIAQNRRNVSTNTDQTVELTAIFDDKMDKNKIPENEIRQEIAEQFAIELKKLDNLYKSKMSNMEQQNRETFVQLKQMVESKAMEVLSLENLIMSERNKSREILTAKEEELLKGLNEKNALLTDINSLKEEMAECDCLKEEIDGSKFKLAKLKKELAEKKKQLLTEKNKSLKLEYDLKVSQALKTNTKNGDKQLEMLKEKYKSVKKTALNYKEYVNEKDRHVKSELARIKANYESAINRLQAKLDAVISTKEEQVNKRIYDMESDFEQKLSEFNSDNR